MSARRKEVLRVIAEEGSQAAAARKLGITPQRVSQIVKRVDVKDGPGRPKGSRNETHVADQIAPKPPRYNGPVRKNRTGLQEPGIYSRAQQELRAALDGVNKSALSRELGYKQRDMIYWLLNGSLPRPSLPVAVEFERRFGVKCVHWFEPPEESL